jgi:hypothetical protein
MFGDDYCLVSKELLLFLKWVCNNDPTLINDFVEKAWSSGFKNFVGNEKHLDKTFLFDLNNSAVDFFSAVESLIDKLIERSNKKSENCLDENFTSDCIVGCLSNSNDIKDDPENIICSKKRSGCEEKSFDLSDQNSIFCDKDSMLKNFLKNWESKNKTIH